MATRTTQDELCIRHYKKIDTMVSNLKHAILEAEAEEKQWRGATSEQRFKKALNILHKAVNDFNKP